MDDDSLHSLLARGRLSGAQRDEVFERALRTTRQRQTRRWAAWGAAALVPLAAGAALLLRDPIELASPPAPTGTLVPKGAAGPVLSARCEGRAAGECRAGDRLLFEIEGATQPGFFAAYADCQNGGRIWYFPTATGELPPIAADQGRAVVGKAARIGAEHGLGTCQLKLFALAQPETRATLVSGDGGHSVRTSLELDVKP